jgi:hypothetical protein
MPYRRDLLRPFRLGLRVGLIIYLLPIIGISLVQGGLANRRDDLVGFGILLGLVGLLLLHFTTRVSYAENPPPRTSALPPQAYPQPSRAVPAPFASTPAAHPATARPVVAEGGARQSSTSAMPRRTAAATTTSRMARVIVLTDGSTIDPARILADLRRAHDPAATISGISGGPPALAVPGSAKGAAFAILTRGVRVLCLEFRKPADGLAEMIQYTRQDNAVYAPLQRQQCHVICDVSEGGDGVAITTALFAVAQAMRGAGALGIQHRSAWQCATMDQVDAMLRPDILAQIRAGMAKAVWCNLIPFHTATGTWWATKGNHVFGLPDFALWNQGQLPQEAVSAFLLNLFDYVQSGHVIKPGEILAFPPHRLQAGTVTEHKEFIAGYGETITLRFV